MNLQQYATVANSCFLLFSLSRTSLVQQASNYTAFSKYTGRLSEIFY